MNDEKLQICLGREKVFASAFKKLNINTKMETHLHEGFERLLEKKILLRGYNILGKKKGLTKAGRVHKLNPEKFNELFIIFWDREQLEVFLESEYYNGNIEKSKGVKKFITEMFNLLDVSDYKYSPSDSLTDIWNKVGKNESKYLSVRFIQSFKHEEILKALPNLYYDYITNPSEFRKSFKRILEDLDYCLKSIGDNVFETKQLLITSILINQLSQYRKSNKNRYIEYTKQALIRNLEKLDTMGVIMPNKHKKK